MPDRLAQGKTVRFVKFFIFRSQFEPCLHQDFFMRDLFSLSHNPESSKNAAWSTQPWHSEFRKKAVYNPTSERKGICSPNKLALWCLLLDGWTQKYTSYTLLRNSTKSTLQLIEVPVLQLNQPRTDVDRQSAKTDKALCDTIRPPGVTDERIIGQDKKTKKKPLWHKNQ